VDGGLSIRLLRRFRRYQVGGTALSLPRPARWSR
jgi:hypothetical protein